MNLEQKIALAFVTIAVAVIVLSTMMRPHIREEEQCRQGFCEDICIELGYDTAQELGNKCRCDKFIEILGTNVSLTYINMDFERCYPE